MNMKIRQQKWLYATPLLFLLVFNIIVLLFSPGIAGTKSASDIDDLERIVLNELDVDLTSFSIIEDLEKLPGVSCRESWSDVGEREPDPAYAEGSMYGISCDLPRVWIGSAGVWNLIVPFISRAEFSFDDQDNLVGSSISVFGYFTRLFYQ